GQPRMIATATTQHEQHWCLVLIARDPPPPDLVHEPDQRGDLVGRCGLAETVAADRRTALDQAVLLMDVRIAERDMPAEQGPSGQEQGHERGLADARLPTDSNKAALGQLNVQRLPTRVVAHQQRCPGAAYISTLAELGQERAMGID